MTLTATDSEASIKIKLWNAASTLLDVGHEGTKMAIKNLVVGTFRGQVNLLSTQETCIEVSTCFVKIFVWRRIISRVTMTKYCIYSGPCYLQPLL